MDATLCRELGRSCWDEFNHLARACVFAVRSEEPLPAELRDESAAETLARKAELAREYWMLCCGAN